LPQIYYSDAERTAAYIFNRMIHTNETESPYEKLFKRKVKLDKLFGFGCVCYAQVPIEVRGKGKKLEDAGIRCRLLGYGDDNLNEHRQGYKLLSEKDLKVFYSLDVVFKPELEMTPIDHQITEVTESLN
jgi:hypothetical protein